LKILRYFATALAIAAGLLGLAALTALVPDVQTWAAQLALNQRPGMHATLGSLSAGFGEVDVEDARLESKGAVLSLPSLRARLPVLAALWHRRLPIESLVAKGWTLDLSQGAAPAGAKGGAPGIASVRPGLRPAAAAAVAALGALRTWQVPFDGTVDGLELEGDVLLASADGGAPIQVHLSIKGGGFGAGREARFDVEAAVVGAQIPAAFTFAQGRVLAGLGPDGTIGRLEIKAGFSPVGESGPDGPGMSIEASARREGGALACLLDVSRGARRVMSVDAHGKGSPVRLAGTWTVDLRDADVAPFGPYADLPSVEMTGKGTFDADGEFARVHAAGHLHAVAAKLGGLPPLLGRLHSLALETDFDMTAGAGLLRVASLRVSAGETEPMVVLKTLQAFEFDSLARRVAIADRSGDFIEGTFRDLPLALLFGPSARVGFASGRATGAFAVRATDRGFVFELDRPAKAAGVLLLGPGRLLGPGLEMSPSLKASYVSGAWEIELPPTDLRREGRILATLEAKASRAAGAGQPILVSGAWRMDLEALASQLPRRAWGWPAGRTASGEFKAKIADSAAVDCKVTAVGLDPAHQISADVHADVDSDGDFTFTVPVRVARGADASAVTAEGGVSFLGSETRIEAKIEGDDVAIAHLRALSAPVAALQSQEPEAAHVGPTPAWGALKGRVDFAFKRLRVASDAYEGVSGTLTFDHDSVRLNGGRVWLLQHDLGIVTGLLTFDPAKALPYDLNAAVSVGDFDAAALFGKARGDELLPVEGRFSLDATVTASAADLGGLLGASREEVRVRSPSGILRLLKTNVADAIPEVQSRVSDTLGDVGSAVGAVLFGMKRDSPTYGKNPVSKAADAVLTFTYDVSEIGYDKLEVAARRDPDGSIQIEDIEMTAPNEHLTGSGKIAPAPGLPFTARPLSLELRLALRGDPAKLLAAAGLLAAQKDALGYVPLVQAVRLGGTLAQVDAAPWHDMLAAVAAKAAAEGAKAK
jgi:hypothetical protein